MADGKSFNLVDFKAALRTGGARPNLFIVELEFPQALTGSVDKRQFTMLCKASQIPGQDIAPIELGYFGRKIKVAGDRTFPEWSITVFNDEDFAVRSAFESWNNALNMHRANLRARPAEFQKDYKARATVTQYTKVGDVAAKYWFEGVWPSNVQPIDLAWDNNDSVEEFQTTLQYDWWEAATTT